MATIVNTPESIYSYVCILNKGTSEKDLAKQRIGGCSVYHGSFHTLKGNAFLNDEVLTKLKLCLMY